MARITYETDQVGNGKSKPLLSTKVKLGSIINKMGFVALEFIIAKVGISD